MVAAVLLILTAGAFVLDSSSYQSRVTTSFLDEFQRLQVSAQSFKELASEEGKSQLRGISRNLQEVFSSDKPFLAKIDFLRDAFFSFLGEGRKGIVELQQFVSSLLQFFDRSDKFLVEIPELLFTQQGDALLRALRELRDDLRAAEEHGRNVEILAKKLQTSLVYDASDFFSFGFDIQKMRVLLDRLVAWLEDQHPRLIAVMLENPSELRPGGGFVGSYLEVTLQRGNIENIRVVDTAKVDKELSLRVVPPRPLQAIMSTWGAADANWFLNFPDSAEKFLSFLDNSSFANPKKRQFDAAIGVSGSAVADLLRITGPVEVSSFDLTFDADNLITELQAQIQKARAHKSENPKEVEQKFFEALVQRLAALDEVKKRLLIDAARKWVTQGKVRIYVRDAELQTALSSFQLTGEVFPLEHGFYGDYLAVASANIGGQKTDLFVNTNVFLQSQVGEDGTVSDHLVIEKKHEGFRSSYWWHRATHKSYLKVYTPQGTKLEYFKGGVEKHLRGLDASGDEEQNEDPLVAQIERTTQDYLSYPALQSFEESGKNVFGFWMEVRRGRRKSATIDYTRKLLVPPHEGQEYQFVLERQPGSSASYRVEISAPVGFIWKENNLPVFEYAASDDGPRRVVLHLTLQRI